MPEHDPASGRSHATTRGWARSGPAPSRHAVAAYVAALSLSALAFLLGGLNLLDQRPQWHMVLVLTLLGALGASLREREFGPHQGVSFATVIFAAALPLVGPAGATVVGYLSYLGAWRSQRLRDRLFNAAMMGCMAGTGGLVYLALGGQTPVEPGADPQTLLVQVAVPLIVGYAVMAGLNALIIGLMSRLVRGGSALRAAGQVLTSLGFGYFTHALIAFLFVVLWVPAAVGIFSGVLILVPLLITQWTLSQDAAERRSHERTVGTLVAALEAANPYSVGHSARVAELCRRMAPRLGVRGEAATGLHFAALLHDIGLVAVSPRMPQVTGDVDIDYLVAISEHPEAGVRMLQDIDFLADALPGILSHHERMDGRGYPAGLRGEAIPLFARMIAVADAFDSLTTTRSYRDAVTQDTALETLRARAGSHLDDTVVEALADELAAKTWEPTVIDDVVKSSLGAAHDHDDPLVSDLYAAWSPDPEEVVR